MAISWIIATFAFLAVEKWAKGNRFYSGLAAISGLCFLLALFGVSWPYQLIVFLIAGPLLGKRLGRPRTTSLILPPDRRFKQSSQAKK